MSNNQTQMPKEGLHIIPQQRKQKVIKMNYGKKNFDPRRDQLGSTGSRKGSDLRGPISSGKKISRCGENGYGKSI